jgi:hypothetical protein
MFFRFLALLGISASALAADPVPVFSLRPADGAYWNPALSGSGYTVDIGANNFGNVFAYTYDNAGKQHYYVIQGTYAATPEPQRSATNTIGVLTGSFFETDNGFCLGCPYHAPSITASPLGTATVTWTTPMHWTLTVPGRSDIVVQPFRYANSEPESARHVLDGKWKIARYAADPSGKLAAQFPATVSFAPPTIPNFLVADSDATFLLKTSTEIELAFLAESGTPPLPDGIPVYLDTATGVVRANDPCRVQFMGCVTAIDPPGGGHAFQYTYKRLGFNRCQFFPQSFDRYVIRCFIEQPDGFHFNADYLMTRLDPAFVNGTP